MKLLLVLSLSIVVVSGKPISNEAGRSSQNYMLAIDAGLRTEMMKAGKRNIALLADTTKPISEKIRGVAEISQLVANLWKEVLKKENEVRDATATTESAEEKNRRWLNEIESLIPWDNKIDQAVLRQETIKLWGAIDAEIRSELQKSTSSNVDVIFDTSKTIKQKFNESADVAQRAADLWKQAVEKMDKASTTTPRQITPLE